MTTEKINTVKSKKIAGREKDETIGFSSDDAVKVVRSGV